MLGEGTMAIQSNYTIADYRAMIELPENRDKILELIDGEIIEKVVSFTPAKVAARIVYWLMAYLMDNELGYVTGADGGYIMSDVDTFIPDVGYISKLRLPEEPKREATVAPDFAVEVKSPTDSKREMRRKAEKYLAYGTKLVWLVFIEERLIEVYMPNLDVLVYGIDDTLDGGDVLPGFTLPVKDIFPS
jgi:Uma2 family endonuclease